MTILLTSLPPTLKREVAGADIGLSYQLSCIQSWREAGFQPISVNSEAELEKFPEVRRVADHAGVTVISIPTNAASITGKVHHLYLRDVLSVGVKTHEPFAITNADILFRDSGELLPFVSGLKSGQFALSRRIDVAAPDDPDGQPYRPGFDFLAVHPIDVTQITDLGLIFGAPWWDHYFPVSLCLAGSKPVTPPARFIHLLHAERWDPRLWTDLGKDFVTRIKPFSRHLPPYNEGLAKALRRDTGRPARDMAYRMRARIVPQYRRAEAEMALHRISAANVNFLDQSVS